MDPIRVHGMVGPRRLTATTSSGTASATSCPPWGWSSSLGVSGSGKSTFARSHFKPTEIVSSDFCRGLATVDRFFDSLAWGGSMYGWRFFDEPQLTEDWPRDPSLCQSPQESQHGAPKWRK